MTTEEQDAVAGRLIRERQELERKIAIIAAELKRIGERLSELGSAAARCNIASEHEEVSQEFAHYSNPICRVVPSDSEAMIKIVPLASEYRAAIRDLRERSAQLKAIGIEAR